MYSILFYYTRRHMCKLYCWKWILYMASRGPYCILFEFTHTHTYIHIYIYIYIYVYGNKQLKVSDEYSITFITQSSEECVRCIWNLFCYRVWFHEQYLQHSCASCVHSLQAIKKYIHKFAGTEMPFWWNLYYRLHQKATSRAASDENFIKISIFPFQCSCKLNHTNIPCRPCT